MANSKDQPAMPSAAAAELAKRIAKESLNPESGLTLPGKIARSLEA
jgi:hypothetical protein